MLSSYLILLNMFYIALERTVFRLIGTIKAYYYYKNKDNFDMVDVPSEEVTSDVMSTESKFSMHKM